MPLRLVFVLGALAAVPAPEPGRLTREPFVLETRDGKALIRAELFRLAVPENRARASGGVAEIAFVRLPSTAAGPAPPIVWLAGGPGDAGTDDMKGPLSGLFLAMREHGDVIVLDQRGTGLSRPRLDCPGAFDLPLEEPSGRDKVLAAMERLARECRGFWEARGVDLSAYNVNEMADDVEDVRTALGAEKITLVGASFGTQVALATIRRHERSVHRAVLLGAVGPDHALALPSNVQSHLVEMGRLARRDRKLSRLIPDFLGLMGRVLHRLEASPVSVEVSDPRTKRNVTVTVGREDLEYFTRRLLYSRPILEALPAFYEAMSRGNFLGLATVSLLSRRGQAPSAVRFLVGCSSGASPERLRRIESEKRGTILGAMLDFPVPDVCPAWGISDLGDGFRAPIRSEVPLLVVSGSLDVHTPAGNGEEVLAGFPNGFHLVTEGATHFCLGLGGKTRKVLSRFLRGEPVRSARFMAPPLKFRLPRGTESDRWASRGLRGARPSSAPAWEPEGRNY